MGDEQESQEPRQPAGIAGLPKSWSVAVQLVGTFGLAVFLVLYYVMVMQPREAARYDELRTSVDNLAAVVGDDSALLTRDQAGNLEQLFIQATAPQLADIIIEELARAASSEDLAGRLQDAMLLDTDLLSGLRREDGGSVSEMLTNKIINSGIAADMAAQAQERWSDATRDELVRDCQNALEFAIRRAAAAK